MGTQDLNKSDNNAQELLSIENTNIELNEDTHVCETADNTVNDDLSLSETTSCANTQSEENSCSDDTIESTENSDLNNEIEDGNIVVSSCDTEQEAQETESEIDKPILEKIDLSILDRKQLTERLLYICTNFDVPQIKDEVEEVKNLFYTIYNQEVEELKAKYLEQGEAEESFAAPTDELEAEVSRIIKDYKNARHIYSEKLNKEKEINLEAKLEIIEAIKSLVNGKESLNEAFNEFKELQQKFHNIGDIPQNKVRSTWDTYNLHVENFYNYVKINKELRELDYKKNFELKTELCAKAEELINDPSAANSFKILQEYHDRWREIGPVAKEKKDELWERFKAATSKINQNHHEYFENIKKQSKENLKLKTALCEKIEAVTNEPPNTPIAWDELSKTVIEYQQEWKTLGYTPHKEGNDVYERFKTAVNAFFENKRAFYKVYKNGQQQFLEMKTALCEKAEALCNSTDWKKTTNELIKIQKEWKTIGSTPRKQSDAVWNRFRTACDTFFENKAKFFDQKDEVQDNNLRLKQELLEEVKNFTPSENNEETFASLQEFQRRYSEIGYVPFKVKDKINNEFRDTINKLFDGISADDYNKSVHMFRSKIETIKSSDQNNNKILQERQRLQNKLKQLESDIIIWENNIGFFTKGKGANPLIKDFQNKIENGKRNIKLLREKIRILNATDDK